MINIIKKYIPRIILLDTLIYVLTFALAQGLLYLFGLSFRRWVDFIFLVSASLGGVVGIIQLLLKIRNKPLKITLLCIYSVLAVAVSVYSAPIAIFAFASEEHVVERDEGRYLARVVGWLDTDVYYYDHVNFLVQGRYLKIREWYGNGGFDPFEGDYARTPRRTIYYDNNGNIIKIDE